LGTKKNYIYNTVQYAANLIFPLVTFPYVSRVLGPEGTGKVAFINSFTQYFIMIALFGIGVYGSREIASCRKESEKKDVLFSELLTMHILHSVLLTVVYLLVIFNIYSFQADIKYYMVAGLTILLCFLSMDWFLIAIENFRLIALRNIAFKIISILCLFLLVKNESDLFIYFILNIAITIGTYIVTVSAVSGHVRFKFRITFKHYRTTSIIFLSLFVNGIYFILDVTILGFFTNDTQVGYYNAALRLVRTMLLFTYAYHGVLIPPMSVAVTENKKHDFEQLLKKSFSFTSLITVPLFIIVFIYAEKIMLIFAGDKYLPAISALKILAPIIIFNGFCSYYLGILLAKRRDLYRLIGSTVAAAISIILSCILIPFWGYIGSATSTLIAEIVAGVVYAYFVFTRYGYGFDYKIFFQAVISSLSFVVAFVLSDFIFDNIVFNMLISLFTGITGYFIIQTFGFKNFIIVQQLDNLKQKFIT
jgi:O-antigen/teichoic acid export membrane protein